MNFFGQELNAYKANLHSHCKTSDGAISAQGLVTSYAYHGYDVFAFTDHRKTNDLTQLDDCGMTLLSGIELHPMNEEYGFNWHLLAIGVPFGFPGEPATPEEAIAAVHAAGGVIYAAHPYWCGFPATEINRLQDIDGTEVYNSSTRYIGRDYDMATWDHLLGMGRHLPALAVDDVHCESDMFRGWTMIMAKDRTRASLMDALRNHNFYASQGPVINRITYQDGVFEAEFSPCMDVIVVSYGERGACFRIEGQAGPDLTHCRLKVPENWKKYFRLQLRDRNGRYAWAPPVYL